MNRQEAATIIKAIGKHAIETHLTDPGDILDATVMAVEALVPKPDEVTGLVPCGCGGEAMYVIGQRINEIVIRVACLKCKTSSAMVSYQIGFPKDLIKEKARLSWNRAMGCRDERET